MENNQKTLTGFTQHHFYVLRVFIKK